MRATATAQPNIALIKYWGKRDVTRNLPAVGSISITLRDLQSTMTVVLDDQLVADALVVNGDEDDQLLARVSDCLDIVIGERRSRATVTSSSNFPIAAGLASSASAFAALTVAAAGAADKRLSDQALSRLAGRASGSAARSLYGGFAELRNEADNVVVESICKATSWPLQVIVAITETQPKKTGSTAAMEISRQTSPFYSNWVDRQEADLAIARDAIADRDFVRLGEIAEHNCLKMHSVMWASRPPIVYWNAATMRCLETIRRLQGDGCRVFFTIDAGPQVKAVCLPEDAAHVFDTLSKTPGVRRVLTSGLGESARLVTE